MRDPIFLSGRSEVATKEDQQGAISDLGDANAHKKLHRLDITDHSA